MPLELMSIPDPPMAAIVEASILTLAYDVTETAQNQQKTAVVRKTFSSEGRSKQ